MSSGNNTTAAKFSSAPAVEVNQSLNAATEARDPIFPENEDWDEDDFGGGDSAQLDGRIDGAVKQAEEHFFSAVAEPLKVLDNSGDMVLAQQTFSDEYFTAAESLSNDAGETLMNDTSKGEDSNNIIDCVDDDKNTAAKTTSAKISTAKNILEKRRQRRERRQMKPEGQQQQPMQQQQEQQQLSREQPQPQPQQNEISVDIAATVKSDSTTPSPTTSPKRRRQRMAERVAQGKVSLKVASKLVPAARKDDDGVVAVSSPPPSNSQFTIANSNINDKIELLMNDADEETHKPQAKDNGGLVIPPSLQHSKNEARRQRRVVRNNNNSKGNDEEDRSALELLVVADEAIGSMEDNGDDYIGVVATEKEVAKTAPVDIPSKSLLHATSSDYSVTDEEDDDEDEENDDPIIAEIIAKALDDAKDKKEAEKSNSNVESNEIFDLGHNSRDVINEDEAKLLFPTQNAMETSVEPVEPSTSTSAEAAWDTKGVETLSKALDEGMARNRMVAKSVDGKALLQLEMAYSDDIDNGRLEAASSSKLMSQKERIAMYTSVEGFGVGDDSSVENDDLEGDTEIDEPEEDDDVEEEAVDYEDLTFVDDTDYVCNVESNDEVIDDGIDRLEVGEIRSYSVPTFSAEAAKAAEQRAQRWSRNPDAVSDIDDESFSDIDPTRKGDAEEIVIETSESPAVLIKIPPPPPEKLQQWMESKNLIKSAPTTKAKHLKEVELSPETPRSTTLMEGDIKLSTSLYKITSPKSPTKKKPNTIIEELDLKSHKKMAEKIAFASSKAAKKFEEEYSHGNLQEGQRSVDSPKTQSSVSPERTILMPAVGELVGGAFSPWKIPERDDDSNISLNRAFSDNASFSNATAAALRAMNNEREKVNSPQKEEDKSHEESFEVSILTDETIDEYEEGVLTEVLQWLFDEVLPPTSSIAAAFSAFDLNISTTVQADRIRAISNDDESFNKICEFVSSAVMSQYGHKIDKYEQAKDFSLIGIKPFVIPLSIDGRPKAEVLATRFMSFLEQVSNLAEKPLPWDEDNNPLLDSVMNNLSSKQPRGKTQRKTMQELIFPDEKCVIMIFQYLREVCGHYSKAKREQEKGHNRTLSPESIHGSTIDAPQNVVTGIATVRRSNHRRKRNTKAPAKPKNPLNKESLRRMNNLNLIFPKTSPSPFETAVWNDPSIILSVLSFVGNPVTVCVFKRLNVFCNRVVCENEHVLMRDAVRLGGMSKYVRPSFWLWVTEKSEPEDPIPLIPQRQGFGLRNKPKPMPQYQGREFMILKNLGAAGKWHPIIERDVTRAFGNMPPHKTGARYRQDSIVRALVTFGKEELIRSSRGYQTKAMDRLPERSQARHFKLSSRLDHRQDEYCDSSDGSLTPTDTVSDWGGISPVASYASEDQFAGNVDDSKVKVVSYESMDKSSRSKISSARSDISDPVLCGNALTTEMKVDMQKKLRSILHALAARHPGVGYCQGMDYIVAHLLRVLQDTILLRIIKAEDWQTMPNDMLRKRMSEINTNTEIVEEVVFRVMDTFFTTYSLQHMYWPELRCLKTCCRVFEILIRQKLPVLADHFEHHDLNVGLFALGWFQTLFLYLPSMPSATVCHMWDIWLVERSFKIFFRVGTAILFLSQPTLLNHDLEGMMTYLNTFPDATLLRADILIPCALQIKITNKMLVEIEMEATDFYSNHTHGMPPTMG